jgi:cell division protease FtsH
MSANPIQKTPEPFHWEKQETLVDRRNRLPNRIRRTIRRLWLPTLVIGIILAALMSESFMATLIPIVAFAVQIVALIAAFMFQFVILFWFLARTRSYTIMPNSGTEGVSFDDYRGQPEILEQAQQIVTLLRGVKAFEDAGGEPLHGLLLEGPPGTGKTWLAQAISTEANVPFFYMDASGLQSTFIGIAPLKVMGLFRKARKYAKRYGAAVIFLDEIDAVGSRGGGVASVQRPDDPMRGMFGGGFAGMGLLSTLLIEMDGFSQEQGWRARLRAWFYKTFLRRKPPKPQRRVLVIGATNRIGALDPALLRPGRFDKKIRVDTPDMLGRMEIFEYYLQKFAHDETMDPAILATETPGYTPADIKYLLNESLRYAFFEGRSYITYRDFMRAQPEHESGLRSPIKHLDPEARRRTAYHEAGHAVAVRLFMPHHRISRITIIRQGFAFGHVLHYPAREAFPGLRTKPMILNRTKVAVAGKAAEMEFCGLNNQTLGVGGDFNHILSNLMNMAAAGMLGTMGAGMSLGFDMFSGRVFADLTGEQKRAIEELYHQILTETRQALRENKHIVEALVELLLEKEELLADEVRAFFDQYGLHTPDPTIIRDGEEYRILPPSVLDDPQLEGPKVGLGKEK